MRAFISVIAVAVLAGLAHAGGYVQQARFAVQYSSGGLCQQGYVAPQQLGVGGCASGLCQQAYVAPQLPVVPPPCYQAQFAVPVRFQQGYGYTGYAAGFSAVNYGRGLRGVRAPFLSGYGAGVAVRTPFLRVRVGR